MYMFHRYLIDNNVFKNIYLFDFRRQIQVIWDDLLNTNFKYNI